MMKIAVVIARVLLGMAFVFFGLNGFLHFMKGPLPGGAAGDFTKAMFLSGYFYVVAGFQVAGGALLLIGRFVALGLTLLGPVIVNILLFHAFLEPTGIQIGIVVACLEAFLIWAYRDRFAPIFKP
jgi:putative oxidoreductase